MNILIGKHFAGLCWSANYCSDPLTNTFIATIFWVFHQFSKVDREFNSMNIQRRNVPSERILILFSNTTNLFSVAVSKDFPQTILCHQI
jgi:hypothetical protein